MQVNNITKKFKITHYDMVKYQIMVDLMFMKKKYLNENDLDLLASLGVHDSVELRTFCKEMSKKMCQEDPSKYLQYVRNRIVTLAERGFISKQNKDKKIKLISLHENIELVNKGNILLSYNFLALESS